MGEGSDPVAWSHLDPPGLPPRYYFAPGDVSGNDLLESDHHIRCPYKGTASYYSIRTEEAVHGDVMWCYPDPPERSGRDRGHAGLLQRANGLSVDGRPFEKTIP